MKKLFVSFLVVFLIFSIFSSSIYANTKPIKVIKDGIELNFDVDPIIENGTTLVEFRTLFTALGMDIRYDKNTKLVTGEKDRLKIELVIGSKTAIVNGTLQNLDLPAKTLNGRTLVPLRFISQSTGANVVWDSNSRTISINEVEKVKLKLGEAYSNHEIEVRIDSIEYVKDENEGFKVHFYVKNKSSEPLKNEGFIKFKLEDPKFENEVNRLGYSHNFDGRGYIYPGEERTGNYHWLYKRDIKIKEISYYPVRGNSASKFPVATWIVK